jgi:hypothetical protein
MEPLGLAAALLLHFAFCILHLLLPCSSAPRLFSVSCRLFDLSRQKHFLRGSAVMHFPHLPVLGSQFTRSPLFQNAKIAKNG